MEWNKNFSPEEQIEYFILLYGEERRRLIVDALEWLVQNEPRWDLKRPIGRRSFVKDLITKSRPKEM